MSKLTLRIIQAKYGDSMLLLAGEAKVLIDGGPAGVYLESLRDQLLALDSSTLKPPHLDLVMVSHIDADHIVGILDLTAELKQAKEDGRDPVVTINQVWHNSFSDLIATSEADLSLQIDPAMNVLSTFHPPANESLATRELKLHLKSVKQGRQLRFDLETLDIALNPGFDEQIVLQNIEASWECGDLKICVIGPTRTELDRLREQWKKDLKTLLEKELLATPSVAIEFDKSIPNLASIVAIAELGDKSILFTGDARGDMILEWLEEVGRLQCGKSIHFDIIKLPHHGSDRNVTAEFFKRITADHYVMSGDGRHGNPEPHTFEMLFSARPELDYKIHLSYGPEALKANPSYIEEGNDEKLEKVLADPAKMAVLNFPAAGQTFIELVV